MNYNAGVYTPYPIGGFNNNYNPNPIQYMPPQMQPMGQTSPNPQTNMQVAQQQPPQAQPQPQMAQAPLRSNRTLVTSYEEALSRPTDFNSESVYFHQSEPFIFQIYTDMQGKKTSYIYKFSECTIEEMQADIKGVKPADLNAYVTKPELDEYFENLENKVIRYIDKKLPPIVHQNLSSNSKDKEANIVEENK